MADAVFTDPDDGVAAEVQHLLKTFNSIEDICSILDLSERELDDLCRRKYAMSLKDCERKFNAQGRAAIHEAQFQAALDGDRSMLLTLGREYLGQGGMEQDDKGEEETALDRIARSIAAKSGKPNS